MNSELSPLPHNPLIHGGVCRGKRTTVSSFKPLNRAHIKMPHFAQFGGKKKLFTPKYSEHKQHRPSCRFIEISAPWLSVSHPFACLLPTGPSEALRPLRWRHVVHPACRHPAGQCPTVLRWCRETQSPLISPRAAAPPERPSLTSMARLGNTTCEESETALK